MLNDRSNVTDFVNLSKTLSLPGELTESTSLDFSFAKVEKPYESYNGINVKLRWYLKSHSSPNEFFRVDISFV